MVQFITTNGISGNFELQCWKPINMIIIIIIIIIISSSSGK